MPRMPFDLMRRASAGAAATAERELQKHARVQMASRIFTRSAYRLSSYLRSSISPSAV